MEYDIIGDVHGHAEPLERLLGDLGYEYRGGAYRHPSVNRTAIFLGDIIDRGPEQLKSIDIVRRMMDVGTAICLMGNHEHSAIGWLIPDPEHAGGYLRPHTDKNYSQHRVFLDHVGEDKAFRRELRDWMLALPLYADLPEIRCVHACWHPAVIDDLKVATQGTARLAGTTMFDSYRKGHPTRELVDITIRGREVDLPAGLTFIDGDGIERDKSRVRWWSDTAPVKLRDLIVDELDTDADADPSDIFINTDDPDRRLAFFGHYWVSGVPRLMSSRATCLDFSVAAGGALCAYTWRGEPELTADHLTWVDALKVDNLVKFG